VTGVARRTRQHWIWVALCFALQAALAVAGGMPYELFDRLEATRLVIGGGDVDVAFAADGRGLRSKEDLSQPDR
jgi:hypothetical protein